MRILMTNARHNEVRDMRNLWESPHEVKAASGEKKIASLYKAFKPDAVIMFISDMNPEHRGLLEFFRRAHEPHPCVVAVAPFTHFRLINQVLDWGMDAYLVAPCRMLRVKNQIEKLMRERVTAGDRAMAV